MKAINTTSEKLNYLENLLLSNGCPKEFSFEYANQILRDCKANNKSVLDVELVKK